MTGPDRIWKCAGCGVILPSNCDCVSGVAVSWEPKFSAVLVSDLRVETVSENIARDMREGRFPGRSDPLMVRANNGESDPAVLAALPEVQALIAAAFEAAAYAVTEAGRAWLGASGARAAIRALTPADATAALAARDAAMIARGMREAATLLREQGYGTAPKQILARAAEIERDGK